MADMKPLFYVLLVSGREGSFEFAGAYASREVAEAKGNELGSSFRIEAATRDDLEGPGYA
jgi:hypothetical protein